MRSPYLHHGWLSRKITSIPKQIALGSGYLQASQMQILSCLSKTVPEKVRLESGKMKFPGKLVFCCNKLLEQLTLIAEEAYIMVTNCARCGLKMHHTLCQADFSKKFP